jgi:hypothetical protein
METEERFSLMEKRLSMIEDEIEKIQKDLQLVGENCKIETPCFIGYENSFTKKLMKDKNETTNSS